MVAAGAVGEEEAVAAVGAPSEEVVVAGAVQPAEEVVVVVQAVVVAVEMVEQPLHQDYLR